MLYRFLLLTVAMLLQIQAHSQTKSEPDFDKFLNRFTELSINDPYIIIDYSVIDSKQVIPSEDVLKFLSMQLNFQEHCYTVGVYTFNKFYLLRIQKVILALPKILEEYLISVSKEGKYISKILCGGYSADVKSTYNTYSTIEKDRITTVYSVYMHKYSDDVSEDDKKITYIYTLSENGEIIKVEK